MDNDSLIIVGTAHVSRESIKEVEEVIEREKPDIVAVELCGKRYKALVEKTPTEISIRDVIKSGEMYLLLFQWILAYFQRKVGKALGVKPGEEMLKAIEKAREVGASVALIDRDITVTFRRFWAKMSFIEKLRMTFALLRSIGGGGEEIDVEEMKKEDMVETLIAELRKFSPSAGEVLVDERDAFIAGNLLNLLSTGKKIVAVVGAGHQEGIRRYLENPEKIPPIHELLSTPKKPINILKLVGYGFIAMIILIFIAILFSLNTQMILSAIFYWFIINGVLAAAGAAVARAHPLSITVAFLTAWLTSLVPFIGAGWVAGIVELWKREPTSEDLSKMVHVSTVKELLENRVFRVVLVAALTNLGSMIGTFLGAYVILKMYGFDIVESIRITMAGLI